MNWSNFTKQFRLLIWKNTILKLRKPFATLIEILLPLAIVVILTSVRNLNLTNNIDQCLFKEKQMDSMGPIPFIRDFLCFSNTTCYTDSQINWNKTENYDFQVFLQNISTVYKTFPKDDFSLNSILSWIMNNKNDSVTLQFSIEYLIRTFSPILSAYEMIQSDNVTTKFDGLIKISAIICGSKNNNLIMFLDIFSSLNNTNKLNEKESNNSCQSLSKSAMNNRLYELIAPVICGNIYYTPQSKFTDILMKKANYSFVILDKIRLFSVEWRKSFKQWLEEELINGTLFNKIRKSSEDCKTFPLAEISKICTLIYNTLNETRISSSLNVLSSFFSLLENILNVVNLDKFVPLDSPTDIDNLLNDSMINVFAGLVLDPSFQNLIPENATLLTYSIRMPTDRIDSTKRFKVLDKFWTPGPRRMINSDLKYYTSGFVMLQEALDRAFIEIVTNNEAVNIGSSMQMMPTPCYVKDNFIIFASNLMPFLLVISWSSIFTSLIKSIVYEKEKRLKEFMLVMGLTQFVHWLAWFVITLLTALIPIFFTTILVKYTKILEFTSPGIIFLLLFSYVVSFISQAFMLSTFFNKANTAAVVAGLIYFVFYIPFVVLLNMQDDVTEMVYYLTGLLSQVSFCNAVNFIAYWEQSKEGAQFSNLFESTVLNLDFGVGHCIIMLWVNSAIYLIVTWYVEAVFPGAYGIARPWYFLVTKRYWLPPNKIFLKEYLISNEETTPLPIVEDINYFEEVPETLKVGISIQNLTKIFPKSKNPAVDRLNLTFYKSQITAFLGHNGAGKTTTISILTGIFPPSSGTAFISNMDIRKDINNIRKDIGLCPQHNILFDNLTVEDHIYFYGLLKGMSFSDIKSKLAKIVNDVGLTKKMKIKSKKLSGGMKRKLSVAMAFIGDSSVVFLDEPTAGVDPFARRGIWDLLIKYRSPDKTIILTTHHMDEADYLSDRIAIIAQGKLKCCGSAVFLKREFGDGYSLVLVKSENAQNEPYTDDEHSSSGQFVFHFIQKHISTALFSDETRTQWSITLPLKGLYENGFSNLFMDLDNSLSMLNITSYGLSDTSLETVFLKVANDPSLLQYKVEKQNEDLENVVDEVNLCNVISGSNVEEKLTVMNANKKMQYGNVDCNFNYTLLSGFPLLRQQLIALQIKRFHYTKRNYKGFLSEVILPILMIILIIFLLKMINPFDSEPSMVIHPWLMMPRGRKSDLNTFYRLENDNNSTAQRLSNLYRSDLGESGIRCMNRSVYSLKNYKCYSTSGNTWSPGPKGNIPMESPSCNCNDTGYQQCPNILSGGPPNSYQYMASSDILNNLTGYNISDNLLKRYSFNAKVLYGGYQFLLPSNFGLTSKFIGDIHFWDLLRAFIITSQPNNITLNATYFVDYLQDFFKLSGLKTNFTRIWFNNKGYVSMPAYANIFDNLLLRSQLNSSQDPSNYGIVVSSYPFKYSHMDLLDLVNQQMFIELSLSTFVTIALSLIPASFVIFLIDERVSGSKRQQFVSGVSPYVYWISNFFWDIIKYVFSALLIFFVFYVFNYQSYIGAKNMWAFVTVLCGYGLSIIPHMYPFSFIISTPSTSFVVLSAYNMLVGSITTTTTFFLDLLETTEPTLIPVNNVLKRFFLIFPQYCLGRSMMDLSFNYLQYNVSNQKLDYNPFGWDITGKKLTAFGILFIFWTAVMYVIESGIIQRSILGRIKNFLSKNNKSMLEEDADVALERERVKVNHHDDDILKVRELTKIYHGLNFCKDLMKKGKKRKNDSENRKLAVNNICFGVKEGECFGLLGVNGAGKTTTFKMLTGEELITRGDALINGKSIITDMVAAHKDMGFCPQFDALHDLLSCEEELFFYCRIRGIEPSLIASTVEWSIQSLSLAPHALKTTNSLSGGNKRKLSTAISLIGNPKIVFMDEPTSGMDAGARRFLWNRIKKLTRENRAVILTSHNMEECEILCHRLAIMVNGEFQCLGSVQHLKSKFGDDYFVTIRMHSDCDETGKRVKIKSLMDKEFVHGMYLKDENFVSIQYRIDPATYKLYKIFEFFEKLKSDNIIVDYSVCQTTLDTIFINFAEREDVSKILSATNSHNNNNIKRKTYVNDCFEDADFHNRV